MMDQQNWYSDQPQHFSAADDNSKKKKDKRLVPMTTLIACMLITALIGGGVGSLITTGGQTQIELSGGNVDTPNTGEGTTPATEPDTSKTSSSLVNSSSMLPTGNTGTYTKTQIVEMTAPSIVGIDVGVEAQIAGRYPYGQSSGSTEIQTGSGSGVIVTSDGYIVTNNHVVSGADTITVYLYDDTEYVATLVATDEKSDLAVIKIEATGLHAATMGDSDALQVGADVVAIGNPLGELRGSATSGIISALSRTIVVEDQQMTLLQTDAAVNPGNSGGGLFNSNGELVGIINAKVSSSSTEGLGFAIPVNSVKQVVADLMDLGYVSGRAYLGVYVQTVSVTADGNVDGNPGSGSGLENFFSNYFGSYYNNANMETRVRVESIVPGSAAESAGIVAGDLIRKVGDVEIKTQTELSNEIGEYNAGDTATITVERNGEELVLPVVFGESVPDGQS
ncbi:trypsin-like peptidase domain-containing protein [Christensenellaceae bacterium OttesenSCG-928-L17]|nr:trypsin-like peptidase domain-containing protein [Christensenellaceae bacterium OttesenSCG-928-L17]